MSIVAIPVALPQPMDATPTNVFSLDLKKNGGVTFQCDYLINCKTNNNGPPVEWFYAVYCLI